MAQLIKFDEDEVKKAANEYKRVTLALDQKQIVEAVGGIMAKYLPLELGAAKCFLTFSIKEWQQETNKKVSDLSTESPEERINAVKRIFAILSQKIKKVLRRSSQENEVDDAIGKTFEHYLKVFSNR